ncbi:MAG: polysaccharide deacetylase family protein [candidate division Zixibacteria bacterium]|nr:polysaccharide deacetylase family protein [candidate division Zixibacteria bacterium]MBU1469733.1 polysaccharide deacetylase family protein [candidate division Zixibacteria bacterium]MBU2624464.1 polysaccharide deacetylase family protein [candidate division Zixibacteria bacterium]
MRELIKKLLSEFGYYRLYRRMSSAGSPGHLILMYHDISSNAEFGSVGTAIRNRPISSQFEAHLKVVKRTARVLSVEDVIDEIRNQPGLREDTISITFDDGYSSVYDFAYPLLRKHSVPATVYLTTDWINRKMELWWEELAEIFADCDLDRISLQELGDLVGIDAQTPSWEDSDPIRKKVHIHDLVAAKFRELDDKTVVSGVRDLGNLFGYDLDSRRLPQPLSWDQIREMATNGILFGSHTCSHVNLRHTPVEKIEDEIVDSKKEIEQKLNTAVRGFAYPYGQDVEAYRKVRPLLVLHGFTYACTASPGINRLQSDPYALVRETLPATESAALLHRELCLDFVEDK